MSDITHEMIDRKIESQKQEFLSDYKKIVESPSVSALSTHKGHVKETIKIAADLLRKAGAEVKVIETKGNPGIFARIENDPKAKTVCIYNHMDVQPAEEGKDGWTKKPFTFTEESGRFYSRGTTDDKGPAMTALWAAKMAREFGMKTNVEFLWESEEEIGSPNFEEILQGCKDLSKADAVVVSDTIWVNGEIPAITMGLRGVVTGLVRIRTAEKDGHSGMVGGPARNPLSEVAKIVASCVDGTTGEILIPGFRETWEEPSKEEVENYLRSGFAVDYFKKAQGLTKLRSEKVEDVVTAIWAKPTFEVHGIIGGYQGEGVKTAIPPFAELKISFRLIPGQDPTEIFSLFEKHVKSIVPDAEIIQEQGAHPYGAPKDLPELEGIKSALKFATGKDPALIREGGSIGAVTTMVDVLKKPVLFMGLSLPEDSYHGPDESFAWTQVVAGVKSFVKYFESLQG